LVQQIRKEHRYARRHAKLKKPRIVVKGPLAGFYIVDPNWTSEDVEILFAKQQPLSPAPSSLLEDDENFKIEM
jgi:hypothetical protein